MADGGFLARARPASGPFAALAWDCPDCARLFVESDLAELRAAVRDHSEDCP
jgi:hypothetical protein